jgi:L-fuconolactonase
LPRRGPDWTLEALVMVQADCTDAQGPTEVEWVTGLAEADPVIRGIVAFAPLTLGEAARPSLEWLSQQPLVKGVRRLIQAEAAGFALGADFVRGVQLLADYGLSFDIAVRNDQLDEAAALARQCPGVSFVLDHIGNPDIKEGRREPWQQQVAALAALPNVHCKVSGVVTRADREKWQPEVLLPYVRYVLETFGPERVFYGSDWPVETLAARYEQWVATLAEAASGWSAADQQKLFHDNAIRFYRLGSAAA